MLNVENSLLRDIEEYCNLNNISDIEKQVNDFIRVGFNIAKYGNTPFNNFKIENNTSNEVGINSSSQDENIHLKNENVKKKVRIIKNK